MAKKNKKTLVKICNQETGYFYVTHRNTKTMTKKLAKRKYDPVIRKHAIFVEGKLK